MQDRRCCIVCIIGDDDGAVMPVIDVSWVGLSVLAFQVLTEAQSSSAIPIYGSVTS